MAEGCSQTIPIFFGSVGEWSGCAPPVRAAGVGACVSTEMVSGHGGPSKRPGANTAVTCGRVIIQPGSHLLVRLSL
jgi:hypothetical protein